MIRAIIIDDEQSAVDILRDLLCSNGQVEVVAEFIDPLQALEHMNAINTDVVFLKLEMASACGIKMGKRIAGLKSEIDIVYVTAVRDFVFGDFDISVKDHLLKPLSLKKVNLIVDRMIAKKNTAALSDLSTEDARLLCLGSFEIYHAVDNQTIVWRTAKIEELFAYLLYHRGTSVPKTKIVDVLWPDDEGGNVDNKLHATVSMLKKALKDTNLSITIKFVAGAYRWNWGRELYVIMMNLKRLSIKAWW